MVKLVTATPRLLSDHQNVWIPILSALINHFEARREDFDDTGSFYFVREFAMG